MNRQIALFVIATIWTPSFAQTAQSDSEIGTRPQAIVQIRRDSLGADLVKISMVDADFPPEALNAIALRLGKELNEVPRGLDVSSIPLQSNSGHSSLWRASFAVDGLVNSSEGVYRLQPIVRSFAGVAPPHEIKSVQIDFDFEQGTSATLANYRTNSVTVQGQQIGKSIEYRVLLNNQDPSAIEIPDSRKATPVQSNSKAPLQQVDWILYLAFGIGAVASGALVYYLLLFYNGGRARRRA